jgi:hypothetical protein
MNYNFDAPAGESNAQPDWQDIVKIPTGTFSARLLKAELRADNDKGNLAILAEFGVELPDQQDPVDHTEWLTTHRNRVTNKMVGLTYSKIGSMLGITAEQAKNAMIQTRHHAALNELLASKVGQVYRIEFKRSADDKYCNAQKIEPI